MKKLLPIAILAFAFLLSPAGSKADSTDGVTLALVQADLTGHPGDVLTWQYDVINNSGQDIFGIALNASTFNSGFGDSSGFDFLGSGIADGSSLIGTLFAFDSDPAVMNSFNSGVFDLTVALDDGSEVDVFADYSATITPGSVVPEPGSFAVLGVGLAGLALLSRKVA